MKVLLSLAVLLFSINLQAASDSANANATVTAAIAIANVSDLEFGSAVQGDGAQTVAPGSSENAENGSFDVTGEPNMAYTVTLPGDVDVVMTNGGLGTIAVNSFASTPAAGANGLLDVSGAQSLFVGATRAALLGAQEVGSYTATFTIDVVY